VARKRSAIERTLHEGQDVIDAGFGTQSYKSARHSQADTEGRQGGQLQVCGRRTDAQHEDSWEWSSRLK
jgi:hypothetical protein